jgi:hypothetical protein
MKAWSFSEIAQTSQATLQGLQVRLVFGGTRVKAFTVGTCRRARERARPMTERFGDPGVG